MSYFLRLSKHFVNYTLMSFLLKGIGFFLIPVYTRFLTPFDYGIISISSAIATFIEVIYLFGQASALQRFYCEYKTSKEELREYISSIIIFVFITSLIVSTTLSFIGDKLFKYIIKDIQFYPYIIITIWSIFFSTFFEIVLSFLRAKEESKRYAILNIINFSVGLSFTIYFVVYAKEGALGKLKAQLFLSLIFFFVSYIIIKNHFNWKFNIKKLKESLSYGLPIIPHKLAGTVLHIADRIILNHFLDLKTVGIYSLGYQFGGLVELIIISFNNAWVPFFMNTAKEKGESAKKIFAKLTTYYIIILLFIGLCIAIFAKEIIILMTIPSYYEAYKVVPIIVISQLIRSLYFTFVTPIFYLKKTKLLPLTIFVAALFNIALNFILIPKFKIIGGAYANLFSYSFHTLIIWIISNKIYKIDYEYKKISLLFLGGIFFILLGNLTESYKIEIRLLLKLVIILLFPVFVMLSKMVDKNLIEIIKIFKKWF